MKFYVGLHQPSDARHFDRCMISVNRIRERKTSFMVNHWIMDSGAFTELSTHGRYRHSVKDYARSVRVWAGIGKLDAAVSQDYMCEPFILDKTGLTIAEHQRLTIERYDELGALVPTSTYVMPVLQGYAPADYALHVEAYGDRLGNGAWVGVGSVCKRQGDPSAITAVLQAVKAIRPDLRLHGFGVKNTALKHRAIQQLLYSADSMAWSLHERKNGGDANHWHGAAKMVSGLRSIGAIE